MRITWQAAAVAAGVGFLISVLSGLFGGVTFGTLLFRAVLAAVIFGAGAVGVEQIFQRFLPELFTAREPETGEVGERTTAAASSPSGESSSEPSSGDNVEIVLEEDEYRPDTGADTGEDADAERGPAEGLHRFEDSLVEEVSEELGGVEPGGLSEPHPEPDAGESRSGDVGAPPLEAESASASGPEGLESGVPADVDPGELDTLPDIEAFSGDFTDDVGTGGGAARGSGSSAGASSQREGGSSDQDPSVMAKALQTMLNRDERRE